MRPPTGFDVTIFPERTNVPEQTAVLLIAHGSRRKAANEDLVHLANSLRARGVYPLVEIAYLELASPSIPEGGRACVAAGAKRVKMLPYFLSAGTHVASDLEEFRQQLSAECPGVDFELCPHLGLHPLMLEILLERLAGVTTVLTEAAPSASISAANH